MGKINNFIVVYDKSFSSQIDFILSNDIFKSFLFNKTIPILNNNNTIKQFMNSFLNTSNKLEDLLIVISQTDSFLSGEQYEKYKPYILNDFTDLLSNDLPKKNILLLVKDFLRTDYYQSKWSCLK
jgi:hypothetical protein